MLGEVGDFRMGRLENRETEKNNELNKLKTDLETAKNSIKSTSISN